MGASNSSPDAAKKSSMDVPGQFFKHADNSNCSSCTPEPLSPMLPCSQGSQPKSTAKKIDRKDPDTPGAFFRAATAMPPPKGKQVVKAAAVGNCSDQSTDVLRSGSNDSYDGVVRVKSRDSDSFVWTSEDNAGKVLKMVQHPEFSEVRRQPSKDSRFVDPDSPDTPGAFFRAATAMPPPNGNQVDVLRSGSNDSYDGVVRVKSRDSDSFVWTSEDNAGKVLKMVQHPEFSEVRRQPSKESRFVDPDSPETAGQFFRMSRDSCSSLSSTRTATSSKSPGSNVRGKVVQS